VIAKNHARHDGCPEAKEATSTDDYGPLRIQRLFHDQAGVRIHTVELVGYVYLLAQNTTVADGDFVDGGEVCIAADVYVVTDFDHRLVSDTRVLNNGLDMQAAPDQAPLADPNAIASRD